MFEPRAVDQPRSVVCAACHHTVPLPTTEPWLRLGLELRAPQLVSFLCPDCGERITLEPIAGE